MGRYASDEGSGFKQAPAGNHVARCIKLIDIGTQHGEYMGKPTANNQIIVTWELCNELMEDGNPFTISQFYNNWMGDKSKLRIALEAWRNRAFTAEELKRFDLMNVLGKPCMIQVILNEKNKAKVASVSAMPKGLVAPEAVNPLLSFWLDEFNNDVFENLPKGIKAIIEQSDEFKARKGSTTGGLAEMESDEPWKDQPEEDIPF